MESTTSDASAKAARARTGFLALSPATDGPSDDEIVATARIVDYGDPFASLAVRSVASALRFVGTRDTAQVVQWPDGTTAIVIGDLSKARERKPLLLEGYTSAREHPLNSLYQMMSEKDVESMAMR